MGAQEKKYADISARNAGRRVRASRFQRPDRRRLCAGVCCDAATLRPRCSKAHCCRQCVHPFWTYGRRIWTLHALNWPRVRRSLQDIPRLCLWPQRFGLSSVFWPDGEHDAYVGDRYGRPAVRGDRLCPSQSRSSGCRASRVDARLTGGHVTLTSPEVLIGSSLRCYPERVFAH